MRLKVLFLSLTLFPFFCKAQVLPVNGASLCWRLVGFSCSPQNDANNYKVEVAKGNYTSVAAFEKNIICSKKSAGNRMIIELPSFGSDYTWRYIITSKTKGTGTTNLFHFSIKSSPDVDPAVTRLRIIKHAEKYKNAYVFVDIARVLYDMEGNPVWFVPGTEMAISKGVVPRDLKLTPRGTITFITGYHPYEITYSGNILQRFVYNSSNPDLDTFHHEFTMLPNGHYMAMIREHAHDSSGVSNFNMLLEYDEHHNIVWRWSGEKYLTASDLLKYDISNAPFDINDLHENSFYFDQQNKVIYLSVRNVSRIIKIKYPEGTVLNNYGTIYKPGVTDMSNSLFCGQHSCYRSPRGYLYLYNNNTCSTSGMPTIERLQEPASGKGDLKKTWEYQCTVESPYKSASDRYKFYSGGNVIELPDQSLLVSMGIPYCKVFIVSTDKKILWSAVSERYNETTKKWSEPLELYRANIILNRKDLEKMIWYGEK